MKGVIDRRELKESNISGGMSIMDLRVPAELFLMYRTQVETFVKKKKCNSIIFSKIHIKNYFPLVDVVKVHFNKKRRINNMPIPRDFYCLQVSITMPSSVTV